MKNSDNYASETLIKYVTKGEIKVTELEERRKIQLKSCTGKRGG